MTDANGFTSAAANFNPEEEILFDLNAAIESSRLELIQTPAFVARLALLSDASWWAASSRLLTKFGSLIRMSKLESAILKERRLLHQSARAAAASSGDGRQINVTGRELPAISVESIRALDAGNEPPTLFVRSGQLVYVGVDERKRPSIVTVTRANLRGRLGRAARHTRTGVTGLESGALPMIEVVDDIMSLPASEWPFPALDVVVEVPTILSDGSLLDTPGYEPSNRILYEPNLQIDQIPEAPTTDDVDAAVALIEEAVGEFPWTDAASRANFFGLLLTPIVRLAIGDGVPLAIIDAPQAGTGKSLLADVFGMIITGRETTKQAFPRDETEAHKTILSTLLAGHSIVCFDNFDGMLLSPTLELALTTREFEGRILGTSGNMTAHNVATWLITGNNIKPGGALPRRCYHIRIDAQSDRPFLGRKFQHDPLLDWVRQNRGALLRSLIVMARAWFVAGKPAGTDNPLGSFREWHKTIAGILRYARVEGFLDNMEEMLAEDDLAGEWENFLIQIQEHMVIGEGAWFEIAEIADLVRCQSPNARTFTLPSSLAGLSGKKGEDGLFEKKLGYSFRARRGTRHGSKGVFLQRGKRRSTGWTWRVMDTKSEAAARKLNPTQEGATLNP